MPNCAGRGSQTVNMSGVYTTITSPHCPQLTQSAPGRRQLRATLRRSALRKCSECLFGQCGRTLHSRDVRRKRESHSICDTSVTVASHFQLREAMMSGRRSTLRSAKKHKPTNCMPMFIETTCPNTLVEEVTFRASSAKDQEPTVRRKLSEQQRDSPAHGPATVLANERSPALDLQRLLIGESDDNI